MGLISRVSSRTYRFFCKNHNKNIKKSGDQSVQISKWWATKRGASALKTTTSHIRNMAVGVTSGFPYKTLARPSTSRIFLVRKNFDKLICWKVLPLRLRPNKRMNSGWKETMLKRFLKLAL